MILVRSVLFEFQAKEDYVTLAEACSRGRSINWPITQCRPVFIKSPISTVEFGLYIGAQPLLVKTEIAHNEVK